MNLRPRQSKYKSIERTVTASMETQDHSIDRLTNEQTELNAVSKPGTATKQRDKTKPETTNGRSINKED